MTMGCGELVAVTKPDEVVKPCATQARVHVPIVRQS
jgi:hypothetical protein